MGFTDIPTSKTETSEPAPIIPGAVYFLRDSRSPADIEMVTCIAIRITHGVREGEFSRVGYANERIRSDSDRAHALTLYATPTLRLGKAGRPPAILELPGIEAK